MTRGLFMDQLTHPIQGPSGLRAADMNEILNQSHGAVDWLWHGYLAAGNVTLLTSQWKCGKTTLLSILLARLMAGGLLAGLAVRTGRAVIVSEEGPDLWAARGRRLNLDGHAWMCRPFRGRPTSADWLGLIDYLAERRRAGAL